MDHSTGSNDKYFPTTGRVVRTKSTLTDIAELLTPDTQQLLVGNQRL